MENKFMCNFESEIYNALLPESRRITQELWNDKIYLLHNCDGDIRFPFHIGTLRAILTERLYYFKETPSRNNGILLVVIAGMAWEIIRDLSGITGKSDEWLRENSECFDDPPTKNSDAKNAILSFLKGMDAVFEINTFLRHPSGKLADYMWIFHDPWPENRGSSLINTLETFCGIVRRVLNDFSISSGWTDGDGVNPQTKALHDAAIESKKTSFLS